MFFNKTMIRKTFKAIKIILIASFTLVASLSIGVYIYFDYFCCADVHFLKDGMTLTEEWLTVPQEGPLVVDRFHNTFCILVPDESKIDLHKPGLIRDDGSVAVIEVMFISDISLELDHFSSSLGNSNTKFAKFCTSFYQYPGTTMTLYKIKLRVRNGSYRASGFLWLASDKG